MRRIAVVVALLVAAHASVNAQVPATIAQLAEPQVLRAGDGVSLVVAVRNLAPRAIVAIKVEFTFRRLDGSRGSAIVNQDAYLVVDGQPLPPAGRQREPAPKVIAPGGTASFRSRPQQHVDPDTVGASLQYVVFDDASWEGDARAVEAAFDVRASEALAWRHVASVLETARRGGDARHALDVATRVARHRGARRRRHGAPRAGDHQEGRGRIAGSTRRRRARAAPDRDRHAQRGGRRKRQTMKRNCASQVFVLLVMLVAARPAGAQWTQFRGPNGSGVGADTGYPVEFSASKNVVWKTAVPNAPSSPVVVGGRVFLTASQGDQLLTIALDANTGREAWRRQIPRARTHKIYKSNDPASPSPVADEAGVVAFFADFGLVAYANDGKEAWRHPLGPFRNFYGMAASPIIVGDTVILACDQARRLLSARAGPSQRERALEDRADRTNRRLGDADGVQAGRATCAAGRAGVGAPGRLRPGQRQVALVDAGGLARRHRHAGRQRRQRADHHVGRLRAVDAGVRRDAREVRREQGRAAVRRGVQGRPRSGRALRLARREQRRHRRAGRVDRGT